jgi:hypothetical protein
MSEEITIRISRKRLKEILMKEFSLKSIYMLDTPNFFTDNPITIKGTR